MTTEQTSRGIPRRSIAKGAAWAAPVIAVAGTAPFASASHHEPPKPTADGSQTCKESSSGKYDMLFTLTNPTDSNITYTFDKVEGLDGDLNFLQSLTAIEVTRFGVQWAGGNTATAIPGVNMFWLRAYGRNLGIKVMRVYYTVDGVQYNTLFNYASNGDAFNPCCSAPKYACPPFQLGNPKASSTTAAAPASESTATQQKQQAPASSAPASAETKAPATKSATQGPASSAPAVETKVAEAPASSAPASSAATEAPASGSASK